MKIKTLIRLLEQCDPEAVAIYNDGYSQSWMSILFLHRRPNHGGVDFRYEEDEIPTVEFGNGNLAHMRKQGMDVIGAEDLECKRPPVSTST